MKSKLSTLFLLTAGMSVQLAGSDPVADRKDVQQIAASQLDLEAEGEYLRKQEETLLSRLELEYKKHEFGKSDILRVLAVANDLKIIVDQRAKLEAKANRT